LLVNPLHLRLNFFLKIIAILRSHLAHLAKAIPFQIESLFKLARSRPHKSIPLIDNVLLMFLSCQVLTVLAQLFALNSRYLAFTLLGPLHIAAFQRAYPLTTCAISPHIV